MDKLQQRKLDDYYQVVWLAVDRLLSFLSTVVTGGRADEQEGCFHSYS
jgi:hypothetical protein